MKKVNFVSMAAGLSTLALSMAFPSPAAAGPEDFGCFDQSIGCDSATFNGSCRYNVSDHDCTCFGEYPSGVGGGTWERVSEDCEMPPIIE